MKASSGGVSDLEWSGQSPEQAQQKVRVETCSSPLQPKFLFNSMIPLHRSFSKCHVINLQSQWKNRFGLVFVMCPCVWLCFLGIVHPPHNFLCFYSCVCWHVVSQRQKGEFCINLRIIESASSCKLLRYFLLLLCKTYCCFIFFFAGVRENCLWCSGVKWLEREKERKLIRNKEKSIAKFSFLW